MLPKSLRAVALFCCLFTVIANAAPEAERHAEDKDNKNLKGDFDNPGGMWMPSQIPEQNELLKKLGLEIDPKELSDPSSNLLQSVVSLGGCSGSFISAEGLIITNHHCVEAILTYLSQQAKKKDKNSKLDYFKTGYVARSRDKELSAGPAREIFITTKLAEVTDEVRAGIELVVDPVERAKLVEKRMKQIIRRSEEGDDNMRAEVVSYFRDEKFFLIERMRIRDVRLVYAPPSDVGFFGGNEDNWHWPRYTGDFAMLRPYVSKDGKPAPYSADNVPYKPNRHFKISREGLKLRDLVMVAGYPGVTQKLMTGEEFAESVKKDIVEIIEQGERFQALYEGLAMQNEDLRIKTATRRQGLANRTKNKSQGLEAIHRMDIVNVRLDFDRKLQEWIESSEDTKAKYGTVLQDLMKLNKSFEETESEKRTFELMESPIFSRAMTIVRKAEQKEKPDEERDGAYQQRNWEVLNNGDKQVQESLDKRIDSALLFSFIKRILELPRAEQLSSLDLLFGADRTTVPDSAIHAKIEELLNGTALYDLETRQKLFNEMTFAQLEQSQDPLIKFALAVLPYQLKRIEQKRVRSGEFLLLSYKYVEAKRAYLASQGRPLAPDANSTLRVTFGQVLEQRKTSDGKIYPAFTTMRELLKHNVPGKKDFEVPDNVFAAAKDGLAAPFIGETGEVPINVQANVDITGGNSGSAAINGKGELVGVFFDGNEETLYSDWQFDVNVRAMLVDARYFLWTLYNVEKADNLLAEMDIVPGCEELLVPHRQRGGFMARALLKLKSAFKPLGLKQ